MLPCQPTPTGLQEVQLCKQHERIGRPATQRQHSQGPLHCITLHCSMHMQSSPPRLQPLSLQPLPCPRCSAVGFWVVPAVCACPWLLPCLSAGSCSVRQLLIIPRICQLPLVVPPQQLHGTSAIPEGRQQHSVSSQATDPQSGGIFLRAAAAPQPM